jgi:two-component system sensor histidine kinase KdpD
VTLVGAHLRRGARTLAATRHVPTTISTRRRLVGWVLAVAGTSGLVLALVPFRGTSTALAGMMLVLLLGVVVTAAVGGRLPGAAAAVVAVGLADWYFVPPYHTWRIERLADLVILAVFVAIAAIVSSLTDALARRTRQLRRVGDEATFLSSVVDEPADATSEAFAGHLEELRSVFDLDAVSVLTHVGDRWLLSASAGAWPPLTPEQADLVFDVGPDSVLATLGVALPDEEVHLLGALAHHISRTEQRATQEAEAASMTVAARADELRDAMLAAVSHDLRTPLASIKAAATSILSTDVQWSDDDIQLMCQTIDEEADRLNNLVANLLDMSRLRTGSVTPARREVGINEIIASAVSGWPDEGTTLLVNVRDTLPAVLVDPLLVRRAVTNIIDNARSWSREGQAVSIEGDAVNDYVRLEVIDHGLGIAVDQREAVFRPFQRLGDGPGATTHGVGLGLAVARGLIEANDGRLNLSDTPGGGLTVEIALPVARPGGKR